MADVAKEILSINLEDEMRQSYLDYAMSVIVSRALPDVRDGLRDTIKWLRENGWLLDRKRLFVVAPGGAKA